jgi:hypothetical protein
MQTVRQDGSLRLGSLHRLAAANSCCISDAIESTTAQRHCLEQLLLVFRFMGQDLHVLPDRTWPVAYEPGRAGWVRNAWVSMSVILLARG